MDEKSNGNPDQANIARPPYLDFTDGGDCVFTDPHPCPPRSGEIVSIHDSEGTHDYKVEGITWHVTNNRISRVEVELGECSHGHDD